MEEYLPILRTAALFQKISDADILAMLTCLSAIIKKFKKNQIVFLSGTAVTDIGIMLTGSVHLIKEDPFGNSTILAETGPGHLFAEAFSCAKKEFLPITVVAAVESEILFINYKRVITSCSSACLFHSRLIENMLWVLANNNIFLQEKIQLISRKSTREKLLAYLYDESQRRGSKIFMIPFNRQQLADYLCVDRSAMSNELSKLQQEGILSYHKSRFCLHQKED